MSHELRTRSTESSASHKSWAGEIKVRLTDLEIEARRRSRSAVATDGRHAVADRIIDDLSSPIVPIGPRLSAADLAKPRIR